MKVFLSQPMSGRSKEDILEERERMMEWVSVQFPEEDCVAIHTYLGDIEVAQEKDALMYLGFSIMLLSDADVAVFPNGWDVARGCRIERECADDYGIRTLFMNE